MQFILEPGQYFDQERRRGRHKSAIPPERRPTTPATRLFGSQPHPDRGIPRPGYDRRTPRGHRKEFEQLTLTTIDNNRDNFFGVVLMPNRAYELSGQETLDEIAKFSPEMQQTKELTELKTSAEQKAQDRRRPALHRHCAEQCRGAARIAQVGDRQPGQQVHARGLLGFVVRPLHG
ncbi:MAG: hypothetical protein ACLUQ6_12160 [Alistipes onderdonkii]